jgi:hypothetical protein
LDVVLVEMAFIQLIDAEVVVAGRSFFEPGKPTHCRVS